MYLLFLLGILGFSPAYAQEDNAPTIFTEESDPSKLQDFERICREKYDLFGVDLRYRPLDRAKIRRCRQLLRIDSLKNEKQGTRERVQRTLDRRMIRSVGSELLRRRRSIDENAKEIREGIGQYERTARTRAPASRFQRIRDQIRRSVRSAERSKRRLIGQPNINSQAYRRQAVTRCLTLPARERGACYREVMNPAE